MNYSHFFGVGDFLLMESYMSDRERDSIETIHFSFNDAQSTALRSLIEASPRFQHVKFKYLTYPTERLPGVVSTLANQGLLHLMKFTGSSFLQGVLVDDLPGDLPDRFDFLQVETSLNLPSIRARRDMTGDEWPAVLKRLQDRDTCGVVVGARSEGALPDSSRLIDLRGKTSILQAVEVLKRSSGYIGIDSFASVLASQVHQAKDILVKTNNPHVVQHACEYFAPHQPVDFLTPVIGKARHQPVKPVEALPDGCLVEVYCNVIGGGWGDRVEMSRDKAEDLIARGLAVPFNLEVD